MDRTDEFYGLLRLNGHDVKVKSSFQTENSQPVKIAMKIAEILNENDTLVERMIKL